jgi:hypothetical protein
VLTSFTTALALLEDAAPKPTEVEEEVNAEEELAPPNTVPLALNALEELDEDAALGWPKPMVVTPAALLLLLEAEPLVIWHEQKC